MMLFAHTSLLQSINTWIFSFHMHFFFIVCGVLICKKKDHTIESLFKQIKRRLYQLGIPYLVFCALLTGFYCALNLIAGKEAGVQKYLFRIVTLQGIDSMWFIPVFFFAELLMLLLLCMKRGRYAALGLSAAVILGTILISDRMPESPALRLAVKTMISFVFVTWGYEMERSRILDRIPLTISILMIIAGAALARFNGFAAIGSLETGKSALLFYFDAAVTSTAILALFRRAEHSDRFRAGWLAWIGRNTIVILCTNNLLIETIRLLDHKLTGDVLLRTGIWGSLLFTGILILLEIPLMHLAEGPLGPVFGKQAKKG